MTGPSLRLLIGVTGTLVAVGGEAIALGGGRPPSAALLHLAIGLTYLYGGLAIWHHEPANRIGRLMTAVGFTWFIGSVGGSTLPVLNELGRAFEDTMSVLLLALVLAYPSGRLSGTVDRLAVVILAIGATSLNILFSTSLPFVDKTGPTGLYGGLALAAMTSAVVVRRWLIAPARARRELLPVLIAGLVFLLSLGINIIRRIAEVPDEVGAILVAAKDLAPAAIPVALLIGFYRQSEHRLRAAIDAIPDRLVRFTRDGRYVEPSARGDLPGGDDRNVPAGRRLHELMVDATGPALVRAAEQALDTGKLQAFDFAVALPSGRRELEARVAPSGTDEVTAIVRDFTGQRAAEAELRRSSARIVEATDAERRRLERDLHDGAQQRLVSVSLALRLLRARLGPDGGANQEAIDAADEAARALKVALRELRELARGIHPAILTEAGLGAAIAALADGSSVPATVTASPDRRLPPAIEATAYFVISEALANVAKYASASHTSIGASCIGPNLRVEVGDDGVGGADGSRGSGLRGLQDRVAALGGRLSIDSPLGQGTLIVAEIPLS